MTESITRRALNHMFSPRPAPLSAELEKAYECIALQRRTIEQQRLHIRDLNARIEKLEAEAIGLRSLL